MHTSLSTLLLATALCCFQVGLLSACGGCSVLQERKAEQGQSESTRDGTTGALPPATLQGMEVQPRQATLSRNAEITAAYLTLLQALSQGDEEAALQAAEVLATGQGDLALPPAQWAECALWFMERKSVNAIPFLRTACRAQPGQSSLLLLYSEALSEHNFLKEAMALLNDFLVTHPGNDSVLLQKGILELKDNRPAAALATFSGIKGEGRTGFVDYYQAYALSRLGQDRQALPLLRQAIRQLPDFGEAIALHAFLCEKTDDLKEARNSYEKLLRMRVANKDILLRLINISLKLNQPTRALEYYQQGPADDTTFHLATASLFTEFRHYLQAERILKAVASRPDSPPEVYLFLADLAYEQRRDLAAALEWLGRLPDDGSVAQRKFLLTAQLQAEAGQNEAALATVRSGKSRFPSFPDFVNLEARILSGMGRRGDALTVARAGVATWPDSLELAFLLGTLLAEDGQKEEAFKIMEGVIARDGNNYQALNFVGYTLAEQNRDLTRALELLNRANALAPKQFYILDSLAWAHFRAGNLDEALSYIREAVRLDTSSDAEVLEHHGDIAARKGLVKEAREAYRKALKREPANADSVRKKLEELSRPAN